MSRTFKFFNLGKPPQPLLQNKKFQPFGNYNLNVNISRNYVYVIFFFLILILTKHKLHAVTNVILATSLGKIYLHYR